MKFSKEQVDQWYNDYLEGLSQKQIANKYKIAPESIKKYFILYNINVDWNSYHVKLSQEELDNYGKARQLYIDGMSMKAAREKVGIPFSKAQGFKNYLSRTGLKIKSISEVASFVEDHNFFSTIDSEIKAYLLGFFAADGHIEKRSDYDSYTLRVGVSMQDVHIIMLFNSFITNNKSAINVNKHNYASVAITSKQIGEDLLKLGFDSNKTKTWKNIPKLPNELYRHFIRGFFDGDGSVSLNTRKSGNRISGFNRRATFTCYNKDILEQISKLTNIEFNYRLHKGGKTTVRGSDTIFENCWVAEIWDFEKLRKLHEYLYKDVNYFYLRKKQKFDLAILEDKDCYATLQGNLQ
jgi:intein-encoded DNA endonuclease-like protein